MLVNKSGNRLNEVIQFAKKAGKLDDLIFNLKYLRDYGKDLETRCDLCVDFAFMSFYFVMFKRDKQSNDWVVWFNGGLIYHGAPTIHWSVHT